MSFNLKFQYNGIFRRTSLQFLSYDSVERAARDLYSIPDTLRIVLTWVDEERDTISVSSEREFKEYLEFQKNNADRPFQLTLLKFGLVTEEDSSAPLPMQNANDGIQSQIETPIRVSSDVASGAAPESSPGLAVHENIGCNHCKMSPIVGERFKCTVRRNFDLCASCEKTVPQVYPMLKVYTFNGDAKIKCRGLKARNEGTLVPPAIRGPPIHRGITCDECGTTPIRGARFKCTVRDDFDLCEACEAKGTQPHPMVKIYHQDVSVRIVGWKKDEGCSAASLGRQVLKMAEKETRKAAKVAERDFWHAVKVADRNIRKSAKQARQLMRQDTMDSIWPRRGSAADFLASMNVIKEVVSDVAAAVVTDVDAMLFNDLSSSQNAGTHSNEDAGQSSFVSAMSSVNHAEEATSVMASMTSIVGQSASDSMSSTSQSCISGSIKGHALKPMARFVTDITVPDACVIPPSTEFIKIWLVRNDGPCNWPEGVRLVTAGGDAMCPSDLSLDVDSINVGEETRISVVLTAPLAAGRYVSYFRLKAADGTLFGQKLWVDIRVQRGQAENEAVATVTKDGCEEFKDCVEIPMIALESVDSTVDVMCSQTTTVMNNGELIDQWIDENGNDLQFPVLEEVLNVLPDETEENEHHEKVAISETAVVADNGEVEWSYELSILCDMGFLNIAENLEVLKEHVKMSFASAPQLGGQAFHEALNNNLLEHLLP